MVAGPNSISSNPAHGGRIHEASRRFGRAADSFIDFSSNINVFAPPIPEEAWLRWRPEMERYPESDDLAARFAEVYGIPAGLILPAAGGIEAIYLAARLFGKKRVAVCEPGFSDYSRALLAAGAEVHRVDLAGITSLDLSRFDAVMLGNPNNPTGSLLSTDRLLSLNAAALIVDEAFIELTEDHASLLPFLQTHRHLIVLRSLTKSWRIPGLRLGFLATGNSEWIEACHTMQPPWSVNGAAASWAREFLTPQNHRIIAASLRNLPLIRKNFGRALARLPGITVHPAAANFILLELTGSRMTATKLFDALGARGALVRVCHGFHGVDPERFIRVAIRRENENEFLVRAMAEILDSCETEE